MKHKATAFFEIEFIVTCKHLPLKLAIIRFEIFGLIQKLSGHFIYNLFSMEQKKRF